MGVFLYSRAVVDPVSFLRVTGIVKGALAFTKLAFTKVYTTEETFPS